MKKGMEYPEKMKEKGSEKGSFKKNEMTRKQEVGKSKDCGKGMKKGGKY